MTGMTWDQVPENIFVLGSDLFGLGNRSRKRKNHGNFREKKSAKLYFKVNYLTDDSEFSRKKKSTKSFKANYLTDDSDGDDRMQSGFSLLQQGMDLGSTYLSSETIFEEASYEVICR
jgi:hypothetical protein